ncbi:MAG: phosphohydrolase [Flavobacteriales bacterium]|nr:phosphohydrolase [Flavobacteriales bacterium]
MSIEPEQFDEKVMRDADLGHLAADDYMVFYEGLFLEIPKWTGKDHSEEEWRKECIKFMENMNYYSTRGKELFEAGKEKNLNKLKAMEDQNETEVLSTAMDDAEKLRLKEEKKRLKKERKRNRPKFNAEKGIETMFRVSLRNHINLSRIADDKANTLISVNAIILSIVLSALFPKMDSNPWLIYPGMALILVSISTIILATLSTIPKTTHGSVSVEDVKNKRGNLLFFGNFHSMSLSEFEFEIRELMKDGEYLYGSLTRDLYFLGIVLNRKYGLLRRAYLIFVVGLVISILLFAWSILTLPPETISTPESMDIL